MTPNQLTQLIEKQKKYFCDTYNTGHYWLYRLDKSQDAYTSCGSAVLDWHTASIKAILQAQVEMLEKMKLSDEKTEQDFLGRPLAQMHDIAITRQINILNETINSIQ